MKIWWQPHLIFLFTSRYSEPSSSTLHAGMFDQATQAALERPTLQGSPSESMWYGPWNSIIVSLFPSSDGYIVTPQMRYPQIGQIPNFALEVARLRIPPTTFQVVLVVEIKNSHLWPSGISRLERQLDAHTDASFAETALNKVYWIAALGPHWRFGVKEEDGQGIRPLTDWHHEIHDEASYDNLQQLASLVRQV